MRRIVTRVLGAISVVAGVVALAAGPVGAHPLDPPSDHDRAPGAIPTSQHDAHRGIECGEDASPAIGEAPFTCHADSAP